MAISFEESLRASRKQNDEATYLKTDAVQMEPFSMKYKSSNIEASSENLDGWTPASDKGYEFYNDYNDDDYSLVDLNKEIVLNSSQINITQESNSQYIPFKIPRYYDGFDLTSTKIQFYYVNRAGSYGIDYPVNVYYNDENIRFAWLIDSNATALDGKLKFEIQAVGNNSKGEYYMWKSKTNEKINVLPSLTGSKMIEPSDRWKDDFISIINGQVSIATDAAAQAKASVSEIALYAQNAAASAEEAKDAVNTLSDGIKDEVQTAVDSTIDEAVDTKMTSALQNYYTMQKVDELITNIDISDQLDEIKRQIENIDCLEDFGVEYNGEVMTFYNGNTVMNEIEINNDPSEEWTAAYTATVDEKVGNVGSDLDIFKKDVAGNHYKKNETYSAEEIDSKLLNVSVDLTGYATETYVDSKVTPVSTSADANTKKLSSLSIALSDLQESIDSIDTSPRLTYDVVYNDLEDENGGENKFVLYEIENEGRENEVRTPKRIYTVVGGGGGSSSSNTFYINYDLSDTGNKINSYVYTIENVSDDEAIICYDFSGVDPAGDSVSYANSVWSFRKGTSGSWTVIAAETIYPNNNIEFNVSKYILSAGTYQFKLEVSDDTEAFATKTWTVQSIDLRLEISLDDQSTYPTGTLDFDYTPYGAVSKDVHFILDGDETGVVTTSTSGIPMPYTLSSKDHGAHLLEAYITANISGSVAESNHILKDVLFIDPENNAPVIGCTQQKLTVRQYDTTNIVFTVHDPSTESPTVTLAEDGNIVTTKRLEKATDTWQYKSNVIGDHILTITCGETVKTLVVTVKKLDINLEPVTAGIVFDFNPIGKSNSDADRLWSDGDISMSVSDNFDWVNGGYQIDENGDQYFCIKAGTSAVIDYQLFADDAKKNGKEFKLVFKNTNVQTADACFLRCVDNTTATNHIGIQMNVHEAYIYGQANSLHLPYSENDIIEFEFNISKSTEAIPMVMGYEDGVSTRPMVYDDAFDFTQATPKYISLGSDYCDLHIYRFKVYNTSLNARGILNNFIADARNADEMIARYNRNQIYDENQSLDPDILAEKCPWLRVYKLSAPYFTNKKSDKVPGTTIQQIYKNGDPILDNWTCYDCQHSGQGTSSDNYGAAGRNIDFIMNKSGIDGVEPHFVLSDGTEASKITMTRTSVPVAYLNFKANIASSNNMTNAMLANRYNEFKPYTRPFVRDEGVDISFIKDTMQFANAVVFVRETNEDVSTHREFADTLWHFYAIGNIGDSKKTDNTRLTDPDDKYEACVEIMDVELPLSDWPEDTMYNAMGYKIDEKTNEKIYTWAKDENLGILYEKINGEYVLTSDSSVDLNKTYYVDILEHDDFSEDYTYGWRYIYEGDDDAENAEIAAFCHQKWNELYRFVTTSSDEEFKAHLGDYFVLDSALYYYLFTTRYCMADNRAKNSFWHYTKTGEVDSDGNPVRKWMLDWMYDCDTSLGLNNYGKQVYRHGLEDIDTDENGEEIFRESDSTFFCRIRDLFSNELRAMYNTLESRNAWHAESFINQADAWQGEFPEELWRIDIERKYIRSYNGSFINGEGDAQFLKNMCNGRMKYHRRQWERAQEKYMASKYQSSVASSDNAVLRCTNPTGDLVIKPNYKLKLTPYDYMYLNVKYGTQTPIQLRAEPGVEYEIPFEGSSADIIDIYSSSIIQSFGDLSSCYPATVDTSKASKIKELIIGNKTDGYDNPNLTTLTMGSNDLLEVINIENVSGLTQTLDMTALYNLRELYAHGSNVAGATLAPGGKIEIVELPAINAINMRNLMYLTTLDITSLDNLTRLVVENCNTIDLLTVINSAPNLNRVRAVGVNWQLESTALLERLYSMGGIDKDGYNTERAALSGVVSVPVIGQYELRKYQDAWPDLIITGEHKPQFKVTFVNHDGTEVDTQYIYIYDDAIDPRHKGITPTRSSEIDYDYTFKGWDKTFTNVQSDLIITATYTATLRKYSIQYVSNVRNQKTIHKTYTDIPFGDSAVYDGEIPTYTMAEPYTYYLFRGWDKSGIADGDFDENGVKTVTAVFDEYTSAAGFDGKRLTDLSPVEIYALIDLSKRGSINIGSNYGQGSDSYSGFIADGDELTLSLGHDFEYADVPSVEIIGKNSEFGDQYKNPVEFVRNSDGTGSYFDTGIQLFDEDKDFVLAIDYEFTGTNTNAVLAQCCQVRNNLGFKLMYNGGAQVKWGSVSSSKIASSNEREMVVIRHKKGEASLTVYSSNLNAMDIAYEILNSDDFVSTSTLVFGCEKQSSTVFANYASGKIHWAKVWYKDLGDSVCKDLALWPHEEVTLQACGFSKYYIADSVDDEQCAFSLLATHLLTRTKRWNPASNGSAGTGNVGGWQYAELNEYMNNRVYRAIPTQIKLLTKKVEVYSSTGNASYDTSPSYCYVTAPAIIELDHTKNSSPFDSEGTHISYITNQATRKRTFSNGIECDSGYWTRSPHIYTATPSAYVYYIDKNGISQPVGGVTTSRGMLIEISF